MANEREIVILKLENGWYHFSVSNDTETREFGRNDDFYEILNQLQEYHNRLIYDFYLPGTYFMRGEELTEWSLNIECELPETQKKVLEGLVKMHNHSARFKSELAEIQTKMAMGAY